MDRYKCDECGFELEDWSVHFFYDSKLKVTRDYVLVFKTVGLSKGSKIKGYVDETYCWNCEKFVRIYRIIEKDDVENACELVEQGIQNYIDNKLIEINKLKEIKKREEYTIKKIIPPYYDKHYYKVTFPELNDKNTYISDYELDEDDVIEKALDGFHKQMDMLINDNLERYKKDIGANYIVLDESNKSYMDFNPSEKVTCPECNVNINKYVNEKNPCPKCGGVLSLTDTIYFD